MKILIVTIWLILLVFLLVSHIWSCMVYRTSGNYFRTNASKFVDIVLDISVVWLFISIFYILYLKLTMGC
jgi:hypothetical protein